MAKKALVRIFKISDHDNDGLLNDFELNTFQVRICSEKIERQRENVLNFI